MISLQSKYDAFCDLHTAPGAFVMPNPWDAGTAKILSAVGFSALATTSAGLAFATGRKDAEGALSLDEVLANARDIVEACDLPVSADLENGFGTTPNDAEIAIKQAMDIGLVGGSIEDTTNDPTNPIQDFDRAVEQIQAAAQACKDRPFLLTARAENFSYGRADLADTIARLQAFGDAGADVLYAPELPDLQSIRILCQEVDQPVNVVMGLGDLTWSVDELAEAGVKRISVGGSFARVALGALIQAANEVREHGIFSYANQTISHTEITEMMT